MDEGQREEGEHIATTDARAGSTPNMGRPILTVSLIAIVVIFAILLIIYR